MIKYFLRMIIYDFIFAYEIRSLVILPASFNMWVREAVDL